MPFIKLTPTIKFNQPDDQITVSFTIRGKQQPCETAECRGLTEVVATGEHLFYGFSRRNPWICGDSSGHRAFVLLDPGPD